MNFKPVRQLAVSRTLTDGQSVPVGTLAQNHQGAFFQYNAEYLSTHRNLSPFTLNASSELQPAPRQPHQGLHGLFADSLPDGWGLLLQDRVFRQHGILPNQVTPMDRLAFVGQRGIGALSFAPESDLRSEEDTHVDMARLGLEAQTLFDQQISDQPTEGGQLNEMLTALIMAGSSGGARPKAQLYFNANLPDQCRTRPMDGDEAWLVKFTSRNLPLGHEEGLCEAVYLSLAEQAGLQPPKWKLLEAPSRSGAEAWLSLRRFDWVHQSNTAPAGRMHMHSACGLLDADFRMPSLDYMDLIKASRQLCRSPAVGQLQFRRAVFNLLAANQDDHSKNWAFLQNDAGLWQPAPFYDVTFSPHPFNEHATTFGGYGKKPPLKIMQKMAATAGFGQWRQAQQCIQEIQDVLNGFMHAAHSTGVSETTAKAIQKTLDQRYLENKHLFVR